MSEGLQDIQSQKGGKLHLPFSVVSCVSFFWNMFWCLDAIFRLSDCSTSSVKLKKAANLQFRDSSASEASPADSDEPSAKKMRPMRTRRPPPSVLRPTSLLPSVKKRPSRKTKEAAAIYMEMLTKDLRSPDEEEEEEEEEEIGETLEEVKRKMRDDEGSRSRFRGNESFENSNLEQGGERESKMKSVKLPKRKTSSASTTSTSTPARTKDSSVSTKKTVKGREKLSDAQDGLKAEIKTRSSAIKAAQNSAKMSAAENKKPDKSLTETTTRTTRKSGAKAKEVSLSPPPRRVLRAKTNRISLAEDCSSEEEEEDEEEEEEEREEEDEDQGEKVEETMMCKPPRLERNRAASKSSSPLKTRRSLRGRVEMSEPAQEVHTVKSGQKSSRKSNETGGEKEKPVKKTNSKSAEVKRSKKEGKKVTEDEDEMSSKKSSRPSRSAHKSEPVKSEEELVEEESSKVLTRRHMRQMSSENMDCLPHPLPLTSFQKAVQEQKKRPLTGKKKPVEERATEEPQVTSESEVEKSEALTHTNNNNNEENEKTPEEEVQDAKKVAKNTEVMEVKVEGEKEDISEVDLETETPPGKAKTCDLGTPESPFQELMGYKEGALVLPKEEQLSVDVCEKKLDMKPSLEAMVQQPAIMKPSIGDTWREAFKNAKLPKPGQLSPIPHGVRPFERKPFSKSPLLKELGGESSSSPKLTLPTVFPVKRLLTKEVVEGPMEEKKVVTKSLTQLQYEKRTSELVSGLVLPSDSWNQPEVKKPPSASTPTVKPAEGKHLNLPLPVEHTLRKHSPTTVTRKPLPARVFQPPPPQSLPQPLAPPPQEQVNKKDDQDNKPSAIVDLNLKKKVNMTTEEIKGWLSDSTSSGIKHAKNCEIFKNNRCECSYRTRTSGEGGSSNPISSGEEGSTPQVLSAPPIVPPIAAPPATLPPEVDKSVVQPPIQLKELDPKFCTETISTFILIVEEET
ncbi:hypothetical protein AAG570_011890 [Ranatra chinensis]|uniref:Uncharacterized protein n=1 Tax=Ranatra chinensis TaxID=642074 RepID=A0ABD0YZJ9_9HEMI